MKTMIFSILSIIIGLSSCGEDQGDYMSPDRCPNRPPPPEKKEQRHDRKW